MKISKNYKMKNNERNLGYYWVEYETAGNWLILWFNGGYWDLQGMKVELHDIKLLKIDEKQLKHF